MNELIKIEVKDGKQLVSARELHKGLQVTERFSNWFDRYVVKYGFVENVDYVGCKVFNTLAKQTLQDYALSIDVAKHVSMIQRNELGMRFRQYFIECEKQLLQVNEREKLLIGLFSSDPMVVAQSHKALVELETKPLVQQIENKDTLINTVIKDDGLFAISDVGRILKPKCSFMGAIKIFDLMRSQQILINDAHTGKHNLPYAKYEKYFNIKLINKGERTYSKVYFTGVGLKWYLNKLVKDGYITNDEKEECARQFI